MTGASREVATEPAVTAAGPLLQPPVAPVSRPRWLLAGSLFLATCASTWLVGGVVYAAALMTILLAHELGHYAQAKRYRVDTSLPFFIPMPLPPLGTMGAVLAMRPRSTDLRGLFDIAITGPLAGLVPSLVCSVVGIQRSSVVAVDQLDRAFGHPLLFQGLIAGLLDVPAGYAVELHPLALAGWVGVFVTALNLLPIGQLDGGHILYALVPRAAHHVSRLLVVGWSLAVVLGGYWQWTLMIALLIALGLRHPPLIIDPQAISPSRRVLGWATLSFVIFGMTPNPLGP